MNPFSPGRPLLLLAAALIVATGSVMPSMAQPAPPPAADNSLPPNIDPASPAAQVVKLVQAGSDINVINAYVANSSSPFNLDADAIVDLKDAGVPTEVINGMMAHDKTLAAPAPAPMPEPAPAPTPAPAPEAPPAPDTAPQPPYPPTPPAPDNSAQNNPDNGPDTGPPAAPVTVQYFYNTLTPYGSWIQVNGYGSCWRPTTVLYNNNWSPYGDRGHWVYTDCGWYWNSDYSWGVTFHYGRWFRDANAGWCWYPDTQWAPSWVVWRSSGDYCGWAPLPPFAVFTPGVGFFYQGVSVSADFDFGLSADCFIFTSPDHLCDRRPRAFFLDRQHAAQVFGRTTVVNNFSTHGKTIVNNGLSVAQITARSHQSIAQVKVGSLPNARREGWQGTVTVRQVQPRTYSPQTYQFRESPTVNRVENPNNQFNNYHSQYYSPPRTPAPTFQYNQNNNYYQSRSVPSPGAPAPTPRYYQPPVQTQGQAHFQQNVQANESHAYSGGSAAHYYSAPAPAPAAPDRGSANNSGQDKQNH